MTESTPSVISAGPAQSPALESASRASDAGGDQAGAPERREHAAGRQQQLGEQQRDPDQRDDDEGVHRSDYPLSHVASA